MSDKKKRMIDLQIVTGFTIPTKLMILSDHYKAPPGNRKGIPDLVIIDRQSTLTKN
jgi:hypothetical protein